MSRYLAIDYGEKRIGIAITDPLKMFAKPYDTIENRSDDFVFDTLKSIIATQEVEKVIVGLPLSISGEDSAKTKEVRAFFEKLNTILALPALSGGGNNMSIAATRGDEGIAATGHPTLLLWDERYSTTEANDFCKQRGLSWQDSRPIIDQIAAAVILQDYIKNGR